MQRRELGRLVFVRRAAKRAYVFAQEKRVSLPMSLLLQRPTRRPKMSDQEIGGGAAASANSHPVIAAMNIFMAPLFQPVSAGRSGRWQWGLC